MAKIKRNSFVTMRYGHKRISGYVDCVWVDKKHGILKDRAYVSFDIGEFEVPVKALRLEYDEKAHCENYGRI